jgi:hypothetical protein
MVSATTYDRRIVDDVDGQEADRLVLVQPGMQLGSAEREGADREPLVDALLEVRDLAGLVEPHQACREHLAVDAVVPAVALGEQAGDGTGDAADAGLERGAVGNVLADVPGDGDLDRRGLRIFQRGERTVAVDQHVDLVGPEIMAVLGRQPEGARRLGLDLGDEQAVRIASAGALGLDGGAGVKREAVAAVGAGRRHRGRHHPGRHLLRHRREAAEIARNELHVVAGRQQGALGRSEEAREQTYALLREERVELEHQGAEDPEILVVVPLGEGVEQGDGLTRTQGNAEAVDRP